MAWYSDRKASKRGGNVKENFVLKFKFVSCVKWNVRWLFLPRQINWEVFYDDCQILSPRSFGPFEKFALFFFIFCFEVKKKVSSCFLYAKQSAH